MNRRALLAHAGGAGVVLLSGCLSDGGSGTTPTDTTETPQPPTVTDTSFTIQGRTSGTERDEATVAFGDEVTVTGTIWGTDGCKTARLAGATYDAEADELTVAVETTDREGQGGGCTQALVEIDYRAVVSFDGGLPGRVTVTHDRGDGATEVTTSQR